MATSDDTKTPRKLDNLSVFDAFEALRGINVHEDSGELDTRFRPSQDHYKGVTYLLGNRDVPEKGFSSVNNSWNWTSTVETPEFAEECFEAHLEIATSSQAQEDNAKDNVVEIKPRF